jgi:two-component system response regulator VicR
LLLYAVPKKGRLQKMKELAPKRILIIENDKGLMDLLYEIFKEEGFVVQCEQDVEDIFPIVREFSPDVVLMDYLLPGINGGELCAQLKREASTKHIPVVICSAYPQVLLSLGSYGCNAFIAKPFEVGDMIAEVEDCLANPDRIFAGKLKV